MLPHVQAIIVSIGQQAEAATGNRDFFLNKPYGIGAEPRLLSSRGMMIAGGSRC